MSLQFYISTGIFVSDCNDGVNAPITGSGVFTSFLNQCDADAKAYHLALLNALQLRVLNPCGGGITGDDSTTTTTTLPPDNYLTSGYNYSDWTYDFQGEDGAYYDVVTWGSMTQYYSGIALNNGNYISNISATDAGGYPVVMLLYKASGLVTGFGSNILGHLDIPSGSTGISQISAGYDHCLALRNNGTVTGWGRDNWGALNINATINNLGTVRKVFAGIGGSVFLLNNGTITGTNIVNGGQSIRYPTDTGYIDASHYAGHVLLLSTGSYLTGAGSNNLGESNYKNISGVNRISAGLSSSMYIYSGGRVSGYGTNQSIYNTPSTVSGVDVQLKAHIGTILLRNQNIVQWVSPWDEELSYINYPSYIQNNIVAISQGNTFTAAIIRRPDSNNNLSTTGYNYLWRVDYVGGSSSYGGITIGDLYPPSGVCTQTCDGYNISLPGISGTGQAYTGVDVPNCSVYAGTHSVIFNSILVNQLININYTVTGYAPKTGIAATGVTILDYWNPYLYHERFNKFLYYSNGTLSPVSGGWISIGTGYPVSFTHNDKMYSTYISGSGNRPMGTSFKYLPTGNYKLFIYAHGSGINNTSKVSVNKNGIPVLLETGTATGSNYNSSTFTKGVQYVDTPVFSIDNINDIISMKVSGSYLNGVQIISI